MLERADTAEAIGLNRRASALLDQSCRGDLDSALIPGRTNVFVLARKVARIRIGFRLAVTGQVGRAGQFDFVRQRVGWPRLRDTLILRVELERPFASEINPLSAERCRGQRGSREHGRHFFLHLVIANRTVGIR